MAPYPVILSLFCCGLPQADPGAKLGSDSPHGAITMELIVFDLDGTLLDRHSTISDYTSETLKMLSRRDIAYTVATGRTLHGARAILEGHRFDLPQAYKNGVLIWHPGERRFSSRTTLTAAELENVVRSCLRQGATPFVFTLDEDQNSTVYHPGLRTEADRELVRVLGLDGGIGRRSLDELSADADVTHVNAIGPAAAIQAVVHGVEDEPHLVAYSGIAREGADWQWLDVHHSDASKGGAIRALKESLNIERVICFGDSDNDVSMFEAADERYAPANANEMIKSAATAVIGHHDEEGIARFLRERFALDES
jgi:Cof subfamily protein (haloacid dehalogenase superfamily)